MRKNEEKKSSGYKFIYSVLFGTVTGFILAILLFAIFAALIASGKAPESLMPYLTVLTAFLSAAAGAVMAVRLHRGRLLVVGLSVGALMFVLTFICSLFSDSGEA